MRAALSRFFLDALIVALVAIANRGAVAADAWLGKTVALKTGAQPYIGGEAIDRQKVMPAGEVTAVDGEWLWLGRAWLRKQDVVPVDQALDWFTQEIRKRPTAAAYRQRGVSRMHQQPSDYAGAVADLREALRLDPHDVMAWSLLGICKAHQGDPKALDDLTEAVCLDPDFALGYALRGHLWAEVKNTKAALRDLTEAIRLDPLSGAAYAMRGRVHLDRKEQAAAMVDLTMAIQFDAREPAYRQRRIQLAADMEVYSIVAEDCEALVKLQPEKQWAHHFLAYSRLKQGNYAQGIEELTALIQRSEDAVFAYTLRAVARIAADDLPGAIEDADVLLRLQPDLALAYYARATAMARGGDWRGALTVAKESAGLESESAPCVGLLAYLYGQAEDLSVRDGDLAVKYARRACELSEWKDADDLAKLAAGYAQQGDFAAAREWQEKALALVPEKAREEHARVWNRYYYDQAAPGSDDFPAEPNLRQTEHGGSTPYLVASLLRITIEQGGEHVAR